MILNNAEFCAALDVLNLVPHRVGLLASEYVRFSVDGSHLLMDLSSDVVGQVRCARTPDPDFKRDAFIERNTLMAFVNANKGGKDFNLVSKPKDVVIKCGARFARFSNLPEPVTGYGNRAPKTTKVDLTGDHRSLISLAANYATEDPSRSQLNCVYCTEKASICATDDVTMLFAPAPDVNFSFPIPIGIAKLLTASGNQPYAGKNHFELVFMLGASQMGWIQQSVSKTAQENFPVKKLTDYINNKPARVVQFLTEGFDGALSRLRAYVAGSVKRDIMLDISGKAGEAFATVKCFTPSGSFKESCTIQRHTADFACKLPLSPLIPFVSYAKSQGHKVISMSWDDANKSPYTVYTKKALLVQARIASTS